MGRDSCLAAVCNQPFCSYLLTQKCGSIFALLFNQSVIAQWGSLTSQVRFICIATDHMQRLTGLYRLTKATVLHVYTFIDKSKMSGGGKIYCWENWRICAAMVEVRLGSLLWPGV